MIKNPNSQGLYKPYANSLLKIIIRVSHIDMNMTTASIRTKLQNLDTFILMIACNVEKFNMHLNLLLDSPSAQGKTIIDLLNYLFKTYEAVSNKEFVCYIKSKCKKYEEGDDINPMNLMILPSNKYKSLVESKEWNAPASKDEKILTL